MDHLYNPNHNYRVLHDPIRRTMELYDFTNIPHFQDGKLVTRVSEELLIQLMINIKQWEGRDDWWEKVLKGMDLMRRMDEETSNKTTVFGPGTGDL